MFTNIEFMCAKSFADCIAQQSLYRLDVQNATWICLCAAVPIKEPNLVQKKKKKHNAKNMGRIVPIPT